jgi:hypothetical protein
MSSAVFVTEGGSDIGACRHCDQVRIQRKTWSEAGRNRLVQIDGRYRET